MGSVEANSAFFYSTTFEAKIMKSSTNQNTSKQAGKARMGRPPKGAYPVYVVETKKLMAAIKAGSGNLSYREIEEGLCIGRDETGAYSGRYFGRYLSTKAKSNAALAPDRLSQIAESAKALGWLPKDHKMGALFFANQFKHLEVADGELLSEQIQLIKNERSMLLKAQDEAIVALRNLAATMKTCKKVGFMYTVQDNIDGEEVDTVLDGIDLDLKKVICKITESFVFNFEFNEAGSLFE